MLSTLVVLERNGVGRVPVEKLNVMGGSIALGHPFGATGARIVLTLAREMKRRGARYGLATACAAGGMMSCLTRAATSTGLFPVINQYITPRATLTQIREGSR